MQYADGGNIVQESIGGWWERMVGQLVFGKQRNSQSHGADKPDLELKLARRFVGWEPNFGGCTCLELAPGVDTVLAVGVHRAAQFWVE